MTKSNILSIGLSIGKWLFNLFSGNYIGRLEGKIEFLEAENERIKEHDREFMEILQQRKELLKDREEALEKKKKIKIGNWR